MESIRRADSAHRPIRQRHRHRAPSRRPSWVVLLAALATVAALTVVVVVTVVPKSGDTMTVAPMPAYVGPWDTARWSAFLDSGRMPAEVILNSDNGNQVFGPEWQHLAHELHRRGVRVLGYVYTNYGKRSAADVEASIDNYFPPGVVPGDTGVDGLFLDEFGTTVGGVVTCAGLSYYAGLVSYGDQRLADSGRDTGGRIGVWGNPGVAIPECYLGLPVRTFVTAENSEQGYLAQVPYNVRRPDGSLSAGTGGYPPSRFAHVVYQVPAGDVHTIVDRAYRANAGAIFTTDRAANDPQQSFPSPSYMDELVDYVDSHAIA